MGKVFKLKIFDGVLELFFYQNEGQRVHVHIRHKDGREVKMWLDDYSIAYSQFRLSENQDLIKLARKYEKVIKTAWENAFKNNGQG